MRREDEIRLIAYNIWEQEGCIDGHDCEHWVRAEAIWQQEEQKVTTQSTKAESKQPRKKNTKISSAKKK